MLVFPPNVDFFVDDERFLSAGDFFLLEVYFLFVGVEEDCLFLFVRFLLDPLILLVDMFFAICVLLSCLYFNIRIFLELYNYNCKNKKNLKKKDN